MRNGCGPRTDKTGTDFHLWAPLPDKVELLLTNDDQTIPLAREGDFWHVRVEGVGAGTRYKYRLNGSTRFPDPASRFQPEGVHGPSEVVDPQFSWTDHAWRGLPLDSYVIYEMHVGTFTEAGTFEGVIPHLSRLAKLGVTAIELMPVAQFPGSRNWGYDGTYPFAAQNSYGGPAGLKTLVNAAHETGLAVILDVVYNHLGPEGNYLSNFGPYFTKDFGTPWGEALNFCGEYSDPVRQFFLGNANFWIAEFHIDGLRLDACHLIFDTSATHFLEALQKTVQSAAAVAGRSAYTFAESDANDPRYIRPVEAGGFGLDCQWLDDFHHATYTSLRGTDSTRYDPDYFGPPDFAKAYLEGYVYSGQYCPSRKRHYGRTSKNINGRNFVAFIQNHDQIGNKIRGTRLACEISFEALKLASAACIFSPYLPLLFMGEEYGETAHFMYFSDYGDADLIESMKKGRKAEFAMSPNEELPDPQSVETFKRSVLRPKLAESGRGKMLSDFNQHLLRTRRQTSPLCNLEKLSVRVDTPAQGVVAARRSAPDGKFCFIIFNFEEASAEISLPDKCDWTLHTDSAWKAWGGPADAPAELNHVAGATVGVAPESVQLYVSQ